MVSVSYEASDQNSIKSRIPKIYHKSHRLYEDLMGYEQILQYPNEDKIKD